MQSNSLFNRIITKLTDLSAAAIVFFLTFGVLLLSVLFVYLFVKAFDREYNSFLFMLSVLLPLILTPAVVLLIIKFTKHLRYYKRHLKEEIQKNKEKDIILYEQARFAVMGEMMANISHQWKQPLNTINLVILSHKFSKENSLEKIQETFDVIEHNVEYLAQTVNDFLSFFDKRSHQELLPLSKIISEVRSISMATLGVNNIELLVNTDEKIKSIELVSSITQVLLNLINNAKDAIISQEGRKGRIELSFFIRDEILYIECCDSGAGVAKEIESKIFDPYFTTKPKSRGTGLGLYMSKQIIHTIFKGRLYLDKERSSCFMIELPFGENCKMEK